jgi:hypothetical protein
LGDQLVMRYDLPARAAPTKTAVEFFIMILIARSKGAARSSDDGLSNDG